MARIPYPTEENLTPKAREALTKVDANMNVFRMMANADGLLGKFSLMGGYLLNKTKLDPVLREIAIVRVGVLCDSKYEVHQHEAISRRLGMSEELIKAIHEGPDSPVFTPLEADVMRYTDDIVNNIRAGDETFQALQASLDDQEQMELTVTIGFYVMVSAFLRTYDVDIEDAGVTEGVILQKR